MARRKAVIIAFALGLFLGATATIAFPKFIEAINGFDRSLDYGFSGITLGMPLSEVKKRTKGSGTRSEAFRLGQPGGYEIEYRAAAKSGAAYFIFWRTGGHHYYCIGFDRDDHVLYKAKGDT